jgi:Mg-chelatase subunit ChlD
MRFSAPSLLLALPFIYGTLYYWWRKTFIAGIPLPLVLGLRLTVATLLVLALARPELRLPSRSLHVVALVDNSASMLPSRRQEIVTALSRLNEGLGSDPIPVLRFDLDVEAASLREPFGTPGVGTNISRALLAAETFLPEDGVRRIVLFSDGHETIGDARRAAQALRSRGVAVYPVALSGVKENEVLVRGLHVPSGLRRAERTTLTATVEATHPGRVNATLEENGRPIWAQVVTVSKGETRVPIPLQLSSSGQVHYRFSVTAASDTLAMNNSFEKTVLIDGPPRVLLGTPTAVQGTALEQALTIQNIEVDRFDLTRPPHSVQDLEGYDELILDGISPDDLAEDSQVAIGTYVRDFGGGLLYCTSHGNLGRAGANTQLQQVIPLATEENVENQVPPLALVLVIDRSGSMEGEKLAWTKRAALGAISALPKDAQVGVIAFDAEYEWLAPLTNVSEKERIATGVNRLAAAGGTRFYPALEDAYYVLGGSQAGLKHIVLLTDGLSTDGVDFRPLVGRMKQAGITLSTVAFSRQADVALLRSLAEQSGGRFHSTQRAEEVPQIFLEESRTVVQQAGKDRPFRPRVVTPSAAIAGIDLASAPELLGYIGAKLQPGAQEILTIDDRHPALAYWRYGIGHVFAFASDTDGPWAARWVTWPSFGKFWAQLVRFAERVRSSPFLTVHGAVSDEVLEVSAELEHTATLDAKVEVVAVVSGTSETMPLTAIAPGKLRGTLPWHRPGAIVLRARAYRGEEAFADTSVTIDRPYPAEYAHVGDDTELLSAIAALSGGSFSTPDVAIRPATESGRRHTPLTPWLLGATLLLFAADLFFKRIQLWSQR